MCLLKLYDTNQPQSDLENKCVWNYQKKKKEQMLKDKGKHKEEEEGKCIIGIKE